MKHVLLLFDQRYIVGNDILGVPWERFGIDGWLIPVDEMDSPLMMWNLDNLQQEELEPLKLWLQEHVGKITDTKEAA